MEASRQGGAGNRIPPPQLLHSRYCHLSPRRSHRPGTTEGMRGPMELAAGSSNGQSPWQGGTTPPVSYIRGCSLLALVQVRVRVLFSPARMYGVCTFNVLRTECLVRILVRILVRGPAWTGGCPSRRNIQVRHPKAWPACLWRCLECGERRIPWQLVGLRSSLRRRRQCRQVFISSSRRCISINGLYEHWPMILRQTNTSTKHPSRGAITSGLSPIPSFSNVPYGV